MTKAVINKKNHYPFYMLGSVYPIIEYRKKDINRESRNRLSTR